MTNDDDDDDDDDETLDMLPEPPEGGMVLDDREAAIPLYSKVCTYCTHWQPLDGRTCAAYPAKNSIPMAIWMNGPKANMHMTPYGAEELGTDGKPVVFEPAADTNLTAALQRAYEAAHGR